ncbi:MAG: rhomboid family intramembrane serine protease [Desulfotignum sp.]|nr:rhomboid family intramembrane serine protease [Desulfotignum sp.]MCF8112614.1 rhomboid family intramembrane serine protease [Desulfotignum sp.]MCF8124954.1 rhomboid family intramembrane serine protease [Desulfotignum sp.]
MKRIFAGRSAASADLILLILASQNISAHKSFSARGIDILTSPEQAAAARSHVAAYFRENHSGKTQPSALPAGPSGFATPAAFVIMGLLAAIHMGIDMTGTRWDHILAYGASSMFICQGETFRAVTALFLHSDTAHLLGNLAGILLFAGPVIRLSGYGTGPFFLLFAGTCGNLINAGFHGNALLSIGASTAVMGAAGGLSAFQMMQKGPLRKRDRIMPLIAGATLMAFLSHGENTDVWAHVFGFFCGFFAGIFFFPLVLICRHPLREPMALVITLVILAAALTAGYTGLG